MRIKVMLSLTSLGEQEKRSSCPASRDWNGTQFIFINNEIKQILWTDIQASYWCWIQVWREYGNRLKKEKWFTKIKDYCRILYLHWTITSAINHLFTLFSFAPCLWYLNSMQYFDRVQNPTGSFQLRIAEGDELLKAIFTSVIRGGISTQNKMMSALVINSDLR